MNFPRYGHYKDSGVEWLGEVPAHWNVQLLKRTFRSVDYGISETLNSEGNVAVLRMGNINGGYISFHELKYVDAVNEQLLLKKDDLLFNRTNSIGLIGKVGRVGCELEIPVTFASYLVRIRLNENFDPYYFSYLLNTPGILGEARANALVAIGQCNLNPTRYGEIIIATPPVHEQQQISAFLRIEIAKIDALMEEQQHLIKLLKEKRQAVISHAVTKGLDPNAPMKDSGVEWLGEVPAHWSVTALKRHWAVTDCKHLTAEFVDDGVPLASIRESQSRYIDLSDAKETTESFYEQLIEGGRKPQPSDLIFTRNATVGEVAQVADWHPRFAMGQDVCLLRRLDPQSSADYMWYALKALPAVHQLANLMIGSTFKRVNVEEVRNLMITIPPASEQIAIAEWLNIATAKIDALSADAVAAILLLQERRSALIAAAVTGKIDVRDHEPAIAEPA